MTQDYDPLYAIHSIDYNQYTSALKNTIANGVISGLAVSQRGAGANMSVDVALGEARVDGTRYSFGSTTNLTIGAADTTNPRKDLIVINSAGTLTVRAGTAAAADPISDTMRFTKSPRPSDITLGDILLAEVWIAENDTAIETSEISDRRTDINEDLDLGNAGVINFGSTIRLLRGADNRLDLLSGDSFNLISGSYMIGAVSVINSSRDLVGLNQVAQHLDPNAANTYDLGDATLKWRNLYLDQNIIMDAGQTVDGVDVSDHDARHEPGGPDPMAVDAAVGTGSLRTLGTGSLQAAVGSHGHAGPSSTDRSKGMSAEFMVITTGTPSKVIQNDMGCWSLSPTASVERVAGPIELPDDFDASTDIEFLIHWFTDAGTAGNVRWQLIVRMAQNDESFGSSTTFTVTDASTSNPGHNHVLSMGTKTAADFAAGDLMSIRVARLGSDGADTYATDARLAFVQIKYTSS